ncbi:hypothetical protein AB0L49_33185 [Streptomyces antimycoticus]|uniref:hypothetical protein n=1 Tax=Streptomyces antimycoticus TaxID=68175 RepID=UPI0034337255
MFNDVVRPALGPDAWFGVPDEALDRVADLEYADPNWPRQLHAAPWLRESTPPSARAGQGIDVPRKCPGNAPEQLVRAGIPVGGIGTEVVFRLAAQIVRRQGA